MMGKKLGEQVNWHNENYWNIYEKKSKKKGPYFLRGVLKIGGTVLHSFSFFTVFDCKCGKCTFSATIKK